MFYCNSLLYKYVFKTVCKQAFGALWGVCVCFGRILVLLFLSFGATSSCAQGSILTALGGVAMCKRHMMLFNLGCFGCHHLNPYCEATRKMYFLFGFCFCLFIGPLSRMPRGYYT